MRDFNLVLDELKEVMSFKNFEKIIRVMRGQEINPDEMLFHWRKLEEERIAKEKAAAEKAKENRIKYVFHDGSTSDNFGPSEAEKILVGLTLAPKLQLSITVGDKRDANSARDYAIAMGRVLPNDAEGQLIVSRKSEIIEALRKTNGKVSIKFAPFWVEEEVFILAMSDETGDFIVNKGEAIVLMVTRAV